MRTLILLIVALVAAVLVLVCNTDQPLSSSEVESVSNSPPDTTRQVDSSTPTSTLPSVSVVSSASSPTTPPLTKSNKTGWSFVRCKTVDTSWSPLSGVKVTAILVRSQHDETQEVVWVKKVDSDLQGDAFLGPIPIGHYLLSGVKTEPGQAFFGRSEEFDLDEEGKDVVLVVGGYETLRGSIRMDDGSSVADQSVMLTFHTGLVARVDVRTDDNGRFEVSGIGNEKGGTHKYGVAMLDPKPSWVVTPANPQYAAIDQEVNFVVFNKPAGSSPYVSIVLTYSGEPLSNVACKVWRDPLQVMDWELPISSGENKIPCKTAFAGKHRLELFSQGFGFLQIPLVEKDGKLWGEANSSMWQRGYNVTGAFGGVPRGATAYLMTSPELVKRKFYRTSEIGDDGSFKFSDVATGVYYIGVQGEGHFFLDGKREYFRWVEVSSDTEVGTIQAVPYYQ